MRVRYTVLLAGIAVLVLGCGSSKPEASLGNLDSVASREFSNSDVIGRSVASVSLPDVGSGGDPLSFVAPDGGVLIVYFGYTFCPDVCPTTLSDLRSALGDLGDDAQRVEVAMATVDPERDSDDVVTSYLHAFIPEGHPLRTTIDADLATAADAFDVEYSVIKGANGTTEVLHTAHLFAVDDTGEIRSVWSFGTEPETITAGLSDLLSDG